MRRTLTRKARCTIAVAIVTAFPMGSSSAATLEGKNAFGDWRQDAPGVRRLIRPADLPPPSPPDQSAANPPRKVSMPKAAKVRVPDGFTVEMIDSGLTNPRVVRVAPNGDLFVAESKANRVRAYRLADGSAKPVAEKVYATGLKQPFGIAFFPPGPNPEWLYVANDDGLVRFPYRNGDLEARAKPDTLVQRIPWTHHWTRDIVFAPDGRRIYFSVGSGSNVAQDMSKQPMSEGGLEAWKKTQPLGATWDTEERRAAVLAYDPQGKGEKIVATGLRNCSGMAVQPGTGELWCVVNERDELGNDIPFEYATRVQEGHFYGWPWYYLGDHEDPRHAGARPDLKGRVTVPDVLIQAHSAPLQIAFYDGTMFPEDYRGDAFVTLHGSWNRGQRTGYKVVRLVFENGKPTGEYEDFMTGFVVSDEAVWGRPVGVAVARDGALVVTEDGNGTLWRIATAGGKR